MRDEQQRPSPADRASDDDSERPVGGTAPSVRSRLRGQLRRLQRAAREYADHAVELEALAREHRSLAAKAWSQYSRSRADESDYSSLNPDDVPEVAEHLREAASNEHRAQVAATMAHERLGRASLLVLSLESSEDESYSERLSAAESLALRDKDAGARRSSPIWALLVSPPGAMLGNVSRDDLKHGLRRDLEALRRDQREISGDFAIALLRILARDHPEILADLLDKIVSDDVPISQWRSSGFHSRFTPLLAELTSDNPRPHVDNPRLRSDNPRLRNDNSRLRNESLSYARAREAYDRLLRKSLYGTKGGRMSEPGQGKAPNGPTD